MDEAKLELVRDWLTRASHDLGAARALSSLEHPCSMSPSTTASRLPRRR